VKRALLLNADWTPMHFMSDVRAFRLLMLGRAEVVIDFQTGLPSVWDDEAFTSPGPTIGSPLKQVPIPATIRLRKFVHKRWKPPRFRKKVLFNRDGWRCQYCGDKLGWDTIEIEHVMPVSRGGQTTWLNCVATCKPCNSEKDNRTPEEAGMRLLKKPAVPSALHFWDAMKSDSWCPTWDTFIPRNG
jgi:5-methylcytosine-specific restriction endonuclease McrA